MRLTAQEQRLCEQLTTGKSYQEIADALFISINTVRYHVKNLYLKLEVNSRAALVGRLLK
ncbi:MAG: LuxR family transcriptional regulator [Bacteroidetes bacterium]|nr:MAG: LuxR family transcriptional regulator [Bacteroidota bacterium]